MQMILARELDPEGFGLFGSVFALVTLLVPFAGFGVAQYWLKEFGREGSGAVPVIKPSLHLVLINFSVILVSIWSWAIFGPHGDLEKTVILVMTMYISGQVAIELISAKLQLEGRYGLLAFWQFTPHFARLFLLFVTIFLFSWELSAEKAAYIFSAVALAIVFVNLSSFSKLSTGNFNLQGHNEGQKRRYIRNPTTILTTLKEAAPFGLAGIFHLIYFQSDIILIKYISGVEAAGFYNAAFAVMVAVLLFPGIIYQKYLLPKMHRWAHHNRYIFHKVYKTGNIVMLLVGVFALISIFILSPVMIPIFFGEQYQETVYLLRILALSLPLLFIASSVGATLVTQDHMKKKVKIMGGVALLNIVLNIIMIPVYGSVGAAIATVLSNLILLLGFFYVAQKYIFNLNFSQQSI